MNQVFQKKDEPIEEYGNRVKEKLKKLNEASKLLTTSNDQVEIVRKMNEKHAISKFEQNIRDPTIKVLVSASGKLTLDDCINFAMQKELIEKNKNIKACSLCGLPNHDGSPCAKEKNNGDSEGNSNRKKSNGGGNGQQNRGFYKKNYKFDRKQASDSNKSEQKPSSSGYSSNDSKNRSSNFSRSKDGNNKSEKSKDNQKNVKIVTEDEKIDLKTVQEALYEAQNPKN